MSWFVLTTILFLLGLMPFLFFYVRKGTAAIIERKNEFYQIAKAGFHLRKIYANRIAGRVSLGSQKFTNSYAQKSYYYSYHISLSVTGAINPENANLAFYKLRENILERRFDCARRICYVDWYIIEPILKPYTDKMNLGGKSNKKVATDIKRYLSKALKVFGYEISDVVVHKIWYHIPDSYSRESAATSNGGKSHRSSGIWEVVDPFGVRSLFD